MTLALALLGDLLAYPIYGALNVAYWLGRKRHPLPNYESDL